MPPEGGPIDIDGIEDAEARATLWEVLNSQSISGVQAVILTDCPDIWSGETGLADFDRELKQGGIHMVWARVCLKPVTFLRLQAAINLRRGFDADPDDLFAAPLMGDATTLTNLYGALERGEKLPMPLIELGRDGGLRAFQEGRKRAMAAYYAGYDAIPVLVFLNTRREGFDAPPSEPPSEFNLSAYLDREEPEFGSGNPHDNPGDADLQATLVTALRQHDFTEIDVHDDDIDLYRVINFKITRSGPSFTTRIHHPSTILLLRGNIHSWTLRFPTVDASAYRRRAVIQALGAATEAARLPGKVDVESSFESSNPHVRSPDDVRMAPVDLVKAFAETRDAFFENLGGDGGCAAIPGLIRDIIAKWGRDPCDINMGECAIFADAIADRVSEATVIDNVEWVAQGNFTVAAEHAFIECNGRYYDSEAAAGVDDWRALPFFRRNFTEADLEGTYISDRQVAEPGVWEP